MHRRAIENGPPASGCPLHLGFVRCSTLVSADRYQGRMDARTCRHPIMACDWDGWSQQMTLLETLGIDLPIIQTPMAGVSSPAMAAAVSNAGALGSIGVGATDAEGARKMIAAVRERSKRSLNVNVFCHRPATVDGALEAAWLERLRPHFERFGARPPPVLK